MPGSPEHIPDDKTRAEVSALCAYGVPQEEISIYIGIDAKTLRKHYRAELDGAKVKANTKVRRFLFEAATGDALTKGASYADCLRGSMFWAKTQMGFKEVDRVETTGVDGGPIENKWTVEIVNAKAPTA
jgi:hypothetical protein